MICEATALKKYIDKSNKIFFIFGSEIVLKNNSADLLNEYFQDKGYTERKTIFEKDFKNIEEIIFKNAGGSLFGSKTIIEILHNGGRIPKEISNIFEIENIDKLDNIVIVIRSALEKINQKTKWVIKMNNSALIVQCSKLKSFEEKIWVKNKLNFMPERSAKEYAERISDMYSGNLIAQNNEINLLKLTYSEESENQNISSENAEFLPYQLEDKVIELDTDFALRIAKSIKKNDEHYGPLLVFIMGKIITTSISYYQNKNAAFEKAGIWKSKIPAYLNFIKKNTLKKLMPHQKKIYELDLASKGLAGITKDQFWQEIDNMIIDLTSA